jgi:CBS domain-containing protein
MTPNPVAVHPKDSIGAAVRRMEEGGYRHLPVVDEVGRPLGMLSVKRIVHYLVEHFPATVYNLPPDPDVIPHEREGA